MGRSHKEASHKPMPLNLPTDLAFPNFPQKDETVIIVLTRSASDVGFTGFTKYTISSDRISDPRIIVYQSETLSDSDLESVVKYEFGHILGLGHSSESGDLMHAEIESRTLFVSVQGRGITFFV